MSLPQLPKLHFTFANPFAFIIDPHGSDDGALSGVTQGSQAALGGRRPGLRARPHPPQLLASISEALARPRGGQGPFQVVEWIAQRGALLAPTSDKSTFKSQRCMPLAEVCEAAAADEPHKRCHSHELKFKHTSSNNSSGTTTSSSKRSAGAADKASGGGQPAVHHPFGGLPGRLNHEATKLASLVGSHLVIRLAQVQAMAASVHSGRSNHGHEPPWRPLTNLFAGVRRRMREKLAASERALSRRSAHRTPRAVLHWMERGTAAERATDLHDAVRCFEQAMALDPSNVEVIARLCKQLSDMVFMEGATLPLIEEVRRNPVQCAGCVCRYYALCIVMLPAVRVVLAVFMEGASLPLMLT